MASIASKVKMQYDTRSVRKFEAYFHQPQKKRGRPKKKKHKRGRPTKKARDDANSPAAKQQMMSQAEPGDVIDLTVKQRAKLDARLEGTLAKQQLQQSNKRINWDSPQFFERRKRYADSWSNENDLFKTGESFGAFCERMGIDRNVLSRYLRGKYKTDCVIARGRKTLLPYHVMRHLIEGNYCLRHVC